MSDMEMIILIMVFLLGGLCGTEAQPVSVTGQMGQQIIITCSHINAFSNYKYFCRGACTGKDVLIASGVERNISRGRYRIEDEGNTFKVTIAELMKNDTGTYWCGIDRTGFDTYKTVHLRVVDATKTNHPPPVKGNTTADVMVTDSPEGIITNASSSGKLVYIGAGLVVAVLALAFVLLIFIRKRNRDTSTSSGKDHDTVYATPSNQQQDVGCGITAFSSTANESLETENRSNTIHASSAIQHQDTSRDYTIYSNVALPSDSQMQPDSLFYSTVTFNQDTDCSSAAPRPASTAYSTIKKISGDEAMAYSSLYY
ncbi:CMRF35-like molecule 3 isoform X1 [Centroberyx affinis]|uniref:CMRF35-like molecule 3 isoform X1 n=1 Tax=Centroberyx affinis TaxID=166261 RepID=UPI003A5BC326